LLLKQYYITEDLAAKI